MSSTDGNININVSNDFALHTYAVSLDSPTENDALSHASITSPGKISFSATSNLITQKDVNAIALNVKGYDLGITGQELTFSASSASNTDKSIGEAIRFENSSANITAASDLHDGSISIVANGGSAYGLHSINSNLGFATDDFSVETNATSQSSYGLYLIGGSLNINSGNVDIKANNQGSAQADSIYVRGGGQLSLEAKQDISLTTSGHNGGIVHGLFVTDAHEQNQPAGENGLISLNAGNSIYLTLEKESGGIDESSFAYAKGKENKIEINAVQNIISEITSSTALDENSLDPISAFRAEWGSEISISSGGYFHVNPASGFQGSNSIFNVVQGDIEVVSHGMDDKGHGVVGWFEDGYEGFGAKADNGKISVTTSKGDILLGGKGTSQAYALYAQGTINETLIKLDAQKSSILLFSEITESSSNPAYPSAAIFLGGYGQKTEANLTASNSIGITSKSYNSYAYGIQTAGIDAHAHLHAMNISVDAQTSDVPSNAYTLFSSTGLIEIDAGNDVNITSSGTGVYATTNGNVSLNASKKVEITVGERALYARQQGKISLGTFHENFYSNKENVISAGTIHQLNSGDFGDGSALLSQSQSKIELFASSLNLIHGSVLAQGGNSNTSNTSISLQSNFNEIRSFAVVAGAGDLNTDEEFKDSDVISALYAEGDDAHIKLTGRNQILTYADSGNDKQLERTVWAYDGASIELDGWTLISTDNYKESPEHLDVAIAAGTAVNLTQEIVNASNAPKSFVTVNYENDGEMLSYIEGDILSAYEGEVNVTPKDANSGLTVNGNLLAGNKGRLTLNLGKGGVFTGRADSYMDANASSKDHQTFFNPAFSSEIYAGGQLDLDMGDGSHWIVTGQSWVSTLSGHGTINLVNALNGDEAKTSHALHVQNLSGKHTFVLNLNDSNHSLSDMLYINHVVEGSEEQVIQIDSFKGLESMAHLDRIRFATVNASDSDLYFVTEVLNPDEPQTPETLARASRTQVRDVGFYDVGFRIENEARATDPDMEAADNTYDGNETSDTFDQHVKPGESFVKDNYAGDNAQNWYLVRDKSGDSTSDGGESILATARAAYWNAVEIDRLNKRLGDARHANGGTDGFWVRVRNDRIGTDAGVGDFRSRNYAYQFGYDHTKKENDGKRLFGAALDYMDGNTTYRDIEGTGATDRFGVTAYMTWLGDDGWYYDLVGKWGVLSNSFRITSDYGVFVDGDYDNHVLGASFEFGRKLTKENSPWFLEPQAQIQHVMVTEASYSTNQGTHVDQDKINSTITRLGFRIGRNFGEKQSGVVYAKADWLKEWHGHQGIKVTDTTTGNTAADVSIDNKGNWFDVGFGVQSPITDTTYFFADAEYVFGNDLDNTWNFNAGVRWMFH